MKKSKKVMALVMSVLMIVGIMPMNWAAQTVNASQKTESIEITADGLKKDAVYGDADVWKVEVLEDMARKNTPATIAGVAYDGYIQ